MDDSIYRFERQVMRPNALTWVRHGLLLLITLCTTTIASTLFPFGLGPDLPDADPQNMEQFLQLVGTLPMRYAWLIHGAIDRLFTEPGFLLYGLSFSVSLLFILICHEMGHYVACRLYRVDATLPFFIPTPPMIGPAGTFGAFIKILSPMPSRRAIFDIGVAGPIAGFVALIPISIIAFATMTFGTMADAAPAGSAQIQFSDPLLFKALAFVFGHDLSLPMNPNPFYFAAWVGLLVTALNLIPSGQLDGGHAIYAALGKAIHHWTGRIAFVVMAVLSVAGLYFFNSPSGFLIAIILGVMMRIRHPEPMDETPLDLKRRVIAICTLVIFALCFVPFPIKIS